MSSMGVAGKPIPFPVFPLRQEFTTSLRRPDVDVKFLKMVFSKMFDGKTYKLDSTCTLKVELQRGGGDDVSSNRCSLAVQHLAVCELNAQYLKP